MKCQEKEIEKTFWENGLKQWISAILAVSPFLLLSCDFHFYWWNNDPDVKQLCK